MEDLIHTCQHVATIYESNLAYQQAAHYYHEAILFLEMLPQKDEILVYAYNLKAAHCYQLLGAYDKAVELLLDLIPDLEQKVDPDPQLLWHIYPKLGKEL